MAHLGLRHVEADEAHRTFARQRGQELGRRHALATDNALATMVVGMATAGRGEVAAGVEQIREGVGTLRQINGAGLAQWLRGLPDQARRTSDEGLAIAREFGQPLSLSAMLTFRAMLLVLIGDWEMALAGSVEARFAIGLVVQAQRPLEAGGGDHRLAMEQRGRPGDVVAHGAGPAVGKDVGGRLQLRGDLGRVPPPRRDVAERPPSSRSPWAGSR